MTDPRRIVEFDLRHKSAPASLLEGIEGKSRECMRLHREGLTVFEIAEMTGRSSSEVWRAIYDALSPLRQQG
ncbi:MAG: hypothetical protein H6834_17445 [Planctomycetes bacterium]|nr:hypothetical protein [Planctomycetota bacterium]